MKRLAAFLLVIFALWTAGTEAAALKDSESASHGGEAASYQVVDVYDYPGFRLVQFNLAVLSHYSYILQSGSKAIVVDPGRDIGAYLAFARENGLEIEGVLLTHSHADFVAGHTEFTRALGCPIYASATSGAEFEHTPLSEGTEIRVGSAILRIIETPGHTPDGISALAFSADEPGTPRLILTGDALFVGSVGRPDLMGGKMAAATLASMMFDTWTNKLGKLPDDVNIFPAHGAGSLCGAHLSDEPTSTIGAERLSNPYLRHTNRAAFIAAVLDGLPDAPQYFGHNAALNRQGPPPVDWQAAPEAAPAPESLTSPGNGYVVDLRDAKAYAAGHIPNSVNIGLRGRLENWVGTIVPWEADLTLTGSEAEIAEAAHRLHRVGYTAKVIPFAIWKKAELPVRTSGLVAPLELHASMQEKNSPVIVDVRLPNEWMGLRIGEVVNLPLNRLDELSSRLDPKQPVVTVCNSAYRSSLAVGILERNGFTDVSSLDGGSEAWVNAGLPVYGASTAQPATPAAPASRRVLLPERISPAGLNRLMLDLPGTFDLVDIRPPEAFADYNIPGSVNADIADVMENPAWLTGAGPLILVDRDGSISMAVGGVLSQKTKRPVKVLHGGLEAYWQDTELKGVVRARPLAPPAPAPAVKPQVPAAPAQPAPAAPKPPKTKSAGC